MSELGEMIAAVATADLYAKSDATLLDRDEIREGFRDYVKANPGNRGMLGAFQEFLTTHHNAAGAIAVAIGMEVEHINLCALGTTRDGERFKAETRVRLTAAVVGDGDAYCECGGCPEDCECGGCAMPCECDQLDDAAEWAREPWCFSCASVPVVAVRRRDDGDEHYCRDCLEGSGASEWLEEGAGA